MEGDSLPFLLWFLLFLGGKKHQQTASSEGGGNGGEKRNEIGFKKMETKISPPQIIEDRKIKIKRGKAKPRELKKERL